MLGKLGNFSKFAAALSGAAMTALESHYATAWWLPGVTAAISAALVYLVPNVPAPAPPAAVQRPVPPPGAAV